MRPYTSALVLVFVIAFGLRAAHTASIARPPLGGILVQDARHYHEVALELLGTAPPSAPPGPSFTNPGYPFFVATVYAVAGPRPAAVLTLQAALGALGAVLLALAGRRLLDDDAASLAAGLLYAVHTSAIFYDGLLLIPSLTNVLIAGALAGILVPQTGRGRLLGASLCGLALGATGLLRANALLFVPAAAILTWTRLPPSASAPTRRRRGVLALALVASAAVVVAPPILFQGLVHGQWAPVSANAGVNFWIGNNRRAEGIYHAAAFLDRVDAAGERAGFLAEARRRTARPDLDLVEADRFWLREGLAEIRADPRRWLRIEGRKLALFWNAVEAKTNVGVGFHERFSPILARLSLGFGPLAVLAAAGWVVLVQQRRLAALAWTGLSVAVPLATCMLIFVSGEYRHPASLGLCLAAAAAILRILRPPADARWRSLGRAVLAAALAFPVVFHPFPALERTVDPRLDFANHAKAACAGAPRREDFRRARALLELAGPETDPFLLEARLAVDCRAAVVLGDTESAELALAAARGLRSLDLRPSLDLPEEFAREAAASIRRCATVLARLDVVRRDPRRHREALTLGGNVGGDP
jgi:hypothetical protein